MRILLVSDSYPPLIGGATRAASLLAHELVDRGHAVSVVTAWQPGLTDREADGLVHVDRVRDLTSRIPGLSADPHRHTPPPFPDPEATWRIRRILKRFRPDVVHAYGWLTYSTVVALTRSSIPLLISARDYGNICALRTLMQNNQAICSGPAPRKCISCATHVYGTAKGLVAVAGVLGGRVLVRRRITGLHSCSDFVRRLMDRYLLRGTTGIVGTARDVTIPDFREDAIAELDQSTADQLPSEPYILFVGALRRIKGLEVLIQAYQRLDAPPPLVLIGALAPDSPKEFPPGVTVIKGAPYPAILAAWDRSLFGVAPSILPEPLGNVVHEAMSRGKAVIGTRPGGHGEMIIDGESGLLVPAGSVSELTSAMSSLISDAGLRTAMGRAALLSSGRFRTETLMPEFETLYASILAVGSAPTGRPV